MADRDYPLEQLIMRLCPSKYCNGERRPYLFLGFDGALWQRKAVYECKYCGEPHYQKVKFPDDTFKDKVMRIFT